MSLGSLSRISSDRGAAMHRHDVMNIRVQRKPDTRAAALDLAREHYVYCSDIVDQGAGTLSALAAALMENDWWYFWWD